MAIQNFIQPGYYSKINSLTLDVENYEISFVLKTYKSVDGVEVVPPLYFNVNREYDMCQV